MKLRFDNILKPKEWIGLAAGLLVAGGLYFVLIHPSLQSYAELEHARTARRQAEQELERTRTTFEQTRQRIAEAKQQLEELGGSPPRADEMDLQVARLTALAARCRVTLDQYSPIDTVDETDHRAFFVQFTGRGHFAAVQQLFSRIESEIDFVDVTHFTITSVGNEATPICFVGWSCRINGILADAIEPRETAGRPGRGPASTEVALHAQ